MDHIESYDEEYELAFVFIYIKCQYLEMEVAVIAFEKSVSNLIIISNEPLLLFPISCEYVILI